MKFHYQLTVSPPNTVFGVNRVSISRVRGYEYPGLREYEYPGYEGEYPRYEGTGNEGINIQGKRE